MKVTILSDRLQLQAQSQEERVLISLWFKEYDKVEFQADDTSMIAAFVFTKHEDNL